MTTEFDDLIVRLEAATGPAYVLDVAIHQWHFRKVLDFAKGSLPKPYSASVDAALSLVRRGHLWQIKQGFECQAVVWTIERDYDDRSPPTGRSTIYPALALCIAALKADAEAEQRSATGSATTDALGRQTEPDSKDV